MGRRATDGLPASVTFFLTERQRREVLRWLRGVHPDRATALVRAARRAAKGGKR